MVRRIALVLCLLAGFVASAAAPPATDQQAAIENILKLVQRGVSDQVITRHIQAQHFVFDLSTDDILTLRDQGVSDAVISAMLDTGVQEEPAPASDVNVPTPVLRTLPARRTGLRPRRAAGRIRNRRCC